MSSLSAHEPLIRLMADGQIHSGEDIGRTLKVSRAAVWKRLKALADFGLTVVSAKGRGYRLEHPVTLLNGDRILDLLDARIAGQLEAVSTHFELDSTNTALLQRSECASAVCLAEYQTAGRGRRGRQWLSPLGSGVMMSLSWRYHAGAAALEGLSLAVGVKIHEVLSAVGVVDHKLKWPNDILCAGKKLGGVLIELSGDLSGECKVVVGLGLNLNLSQFSFVQQNKVDQPWTDLALQGVHVERNVMAAKLIDALVPLMMEYERVGFPHYKADWLAAAAHYGDMVTIKSGATDIAGHFVGLTDSGSLLLDTVDGVQAFSGGEVSLRTGPSVGRVGAPGSVL